MVFPGSGPDPQDPNSPLYQFIDTQPTSVYPNDPWVPDVTLSHFTYRQVVPTAISKTMPIVVTAPGHKFINGNTIRATKFIYTPVANATGMQQLQYKQFFVQNVTVDTFELFDRDLTPIDGRNFNVYIQGGQFTLAYNMPLIVNPSPFPPPGYPPLLPDP